MPELPPPLPPAERPVGQLVGESMRLYGRRFWRALALGLPPALWVALPTLVWFAALGLAPPVLAHEEVGFWAAFRRSFKLARADFVHALGGLAALTIVTFVTATLLTFLLRDFGDQARTVAVVIAAIVISPLFFLGSALLYFDQVAREDVKRVQRR